jgi:ankyrin repeat protein
VTPLNLALLNLHFDLAAYLIEAGADIEKWDLYGRTPLYLAADTSTLPVQGNGSMVVLPSMDKLTALDVARLLLEKGANPNSQLKRRPPYRNVPQDRGGDAILPMWCTAAACRACGRRAVRAGIARARRARGLAEQSGCHPTHGRRRRRVRLARDARS